MEITYMSILWTLPALAMTALARNIITKFLKRLQGFAVPMVGADTSDVDALKWRYVQQADVLLREGHEKVSYMLRPLSSFKRLTLVKVQGRHLPGCNSRWAASVSPQEVRQ